MLLCLRLRQFSQLSFRQYLASCVFRLSIPLIMIVRVRVRSLIIIKSEVSPIAIIQRSKQLYALRVFLYSYRVACAIRHCNLSWYVATALLNPGGYHGILLFAVCVSVYWCKGELTLMHCCVSRQLGGKPVHFVWLPRLRDRSYTGQKSIGLQQVDSLGVQQGTMAISVIMARTDGCQLHVL